ncbi:MAG: amino acid--tRNA ligase-related protein [bacterium]
MLQNIILSVENKKISIDSKNHFANLARINQSLNRGVLENYQKSGLVNMDVPAIVGITGACENIDTLFKIQNRLAIPLFFTQTGQLSLEQSLQTFHGVFTVINSGRDEEEEDERHLRQFRLTEEEFDCTLTQMTRQNYDEEKMYEALLFRIQKTVQSIIRKVLAENGSILEKVYRRDIKKLRGAAEKEFLRINYEEAVKLLNKNGFPRVRFGDDLEALHEAKVVAILNKEKTELPVFIMKYPKEIKFFNMKISSQDPRLALSADLIFPYAGEGVGSAVREHDFEKLNERLLSSTMYKLHIERGGKYEDFMWYLDIIKNKASNPHAGYGLGNERVLQYIFGERDIRRVSIFSLLNNQTKDWDKARYGQASIILPPKKHILLTIGRPADKKLLLSHIEKLARKEKTIFYATDKTHKFLKSHNIRSSLVYKISEFGRDPNIVDLISKKVFDIIINISTEEKIKDDKVFTDSKLIRKGAVNLGITLITDPEVAAMVMDNLAK